MSDPLDQLAKGAAAALGRPLMPSELKTFSRYLNLLIKWQRSQRLVGSGDRAWIVKNLFLDSLLFVSLIPAGTIDIADFGSGAGLPGIPLQITQPNLRITLVEARTRRASFLREARRVLSLENLAIYGDRVDETTTALRARFDAVVMRCAGRFENALERARPLVRPGGRVIAAGPPRRYDLTAGHWVSVPGWSPGRPRLFAVYTA